MLAARTQRPLEAPDDVGPLGPVIERAGRTDPSERYPDAATMRSALNDVADALPPPAPLRLAGMADHADPHPTQAHPSRAPAATPGTGETGTPEAGTPEAETIEPTAALFDQDAADTLVIEIDPPSTSKSAGPRRLVPFVVAAMLVLTAVLAAIAVARVGSTPIEVPGVVGYSLDDARALASGAELEVEVAAERNAPDPAGTIIDQDPDAGEFTRGSGLRIWVSKGPAPVEVPGIVGVSQGEAMSVLAEAGFPVNAPQFDFSDSIPKDVVIASTPKPGELVAPETAVTVVISKGHEPVVIPEVSERTFEEAQAELAGLGFQPLRADEFSDTVELGAVIRTEPEIGSEQPFESQVTVVVSKGPDLVEVPDVRGESLDDAAATLEAAGFVVEVNGRFQAGRPVQLQDPSGGQMVKRGSIVTIRQQPGGNDD